MEWIVSIIIALLVIYGFKSAKYGNVKSNIVTWIIIIILIICLVKCIS